MFVFLGMSVGRRLIKELIWNTKRAQAVMMWVVFAFVSVAAPGAGRAFLIVRILGSLRSALAPWHFYYPISRCVHCARTALCVLE